MSNNIPAKLNQLFGNKLAFFQDIKQNINITNKNN